MTRCKRHVYKSMCENDYGLRTGRNGKVTYESRPKRGQYKPKKSTGKDSKRSPSSKAKRSRS